MKIRFRRKRKEAVAEAASDGPRNREEAWRKEGWLTRKSMQLNRGMGVLLPGRLLSKEKALIISVDFKENRVDEDLGQIWRCVIRCSGGLPESLMHQRRWREALSELEELLGAGADPNEKHKGELLLNLVAAHGGAEAAEILLRHGAAPYLADKRGLTALMTAAKGGHAEVLRQVLTRGFRVDEAYAEGYDEMRINGKDWSGLVGWSALHFAAAAQSLRSVEALLEAGAISAPAKNGRTPVDIARINGRDDIAAAIGQAMAVREREAIEKEASPIGPRAKDANFRL